MWAILGFVIISIYIFVKYTNDKIGMELMQKEIDSSRASAEEFKEKYMIDKEETYEIEMWIKKRPQEILDLQQEIKQYTGFAPPIDWMSFAYFAKKGKLPYIGFRISPERSPFLYNDGRYIFFAEFKDTSIQVFREARRKFLLWYDEEMRKNGMEEKLLIAGKTKYTPDSFRYHYDSKQAIWIQDCNDIKDKAAFYKPIKSYFEQIDLID